MCFPQLQGRNVNCIVQSYPIFLIECGFLSECLQSSKTIVNQINIETGDRIVKDKGWTLLDSVNLCSCCNSSSFNSPIAPRDDKYIYIIWYLVGTVGHVIKKPRRMLICIHKKNMSYSFLWCALTSSHFSGFFSDEISQCHRWGYLQLVAVKRFIQRMNSTSDIYVKLPFLSTTLKRNSKKDWLVCW